MDTTKFKTNIKCSACVEKVTPALNEAAGEGNWSVDLQAPDRTLTVPEGVDETEMLDALNKVGYTAEKV